VLNAERQKKLSVASGKGELGSRCLGIGLQQYCLNVVEHRIRVQKGGAVDIADPVALVD
jgi:hypothetical protein